MVHFKTALLIQEDGEFKMKPREKLTAEEYSFQWFSCAMLREKFNMEFKNKTEIKKHKTEFELCTNDGYMIAKS